MARGGRQEERYFLRRAGRYAKIFARGKFFLAGEARARREEREIRVVVRRLCYNGRSGCGEARGKWRYGEERKVYK